MGEVKDHITFLALYLNSFMFLASQAGEAVGERIGNTEFHGYSIGTRS